MMIEAVATATTRPPCSHGSGWYVLVKFLIFSRRVFVCSNCGKVFYCGKRDWK